MGVRRKNFFDGRWVRRVLRRVSRILIATLAVHFATVCVAQVTGSDPLANTQLQDPERERVAKALMEELRCVVCQGQSIADSDAPLAGDMRALVRRRIQVGEQPDEIRAWLIRRYGDYISYDPPFSIRTAPLWLAPAALIGFGLYVARTSFRRRDRARELHNE